MCGIVGYIGSRDPRLEVLRGLERLEYRGYDSAGLAQRTEAGDIAVVRAEGRVARLGEKVASGAAEGVIAVGHTRWATHGAPEERNAHPHVDCTGRFAVVHNGIIENHEELRAELEAAGHRFGSDTDTEVVAHLFEDLHRGDPVVTMRRVMARIRGHFALGVIRQDGEEIVAARRGSPLIVGRGDGEFFIASDPVAILERTRRVIYLEDDDIAVLDRRGARLFDGSGAAVTRPTHLIDWERGAVERGGFEHFMRKEIEEQGEVVARTLRGRVILGSSEPVRLPELDSVLETHGVPSRIVINACGTSFHAGLMAKALIERWARIPVDVQTASELRYGAPIWDERSLLISISQSGETADTLAALRRAETDGVPTLGVVNVVGSTIARDSEATIYTQAGPEIGVASTKAFTTQIAVLMMIGLVLRQRTVGADPLVHTQAEALAELPGRFAAVLEQEDHVRAIARDYAGARLFSFLGRGVGHAAALEGALKLKEVSYIPASGYPAGEIKHGPIALIDETVPTVIIAPDGDTATKMRSTASEIRARRGPVVAITGEAQTLLRDAADHVLTVPATTEEVQVVLANVLLQLLAYHVGCARGCDVDKPRNLAKSVTVE